MLIGRIFKTHDKTISLVVVALIAIKIFILNSISQTLFPKYYIFILIGILAYLILLKTDLMILKYFSKQIYAISIILLLSVIIIGNVSRGVVRWIPIGDFAFQPSELVRPFLIYFFATVLIKKYTYVKDVLVSTLLFVIPFLLIVSQPSLGIAFILMTGFVGVVFASGISKKYLLYIGLLLVFLTPVFYSTLADYQKQRIAAFINPHEDPLGEGYSSIQSMISVGAGGVLGRGFKQGTQTQLNFLPERQTDFVFASISEEFGLVGSVTILLLYFILIFRMIRIMENATSPVERGFVSGIIVMFLTEIIVHISMNMGMMPITGIPLPLLSAGGSSFVSNMSALALVQIAKRKDFV